MDPFYDPAMYGPQPSEMTPPPAPAQPEGRSWTEKLKQLMLIAAMTGGAGKMLERPMGRLAVGAGVGTVVGSDMAEAAKKSQRRSSPPPAAAPPPPVESGPFQPARTPDPDPVREQMLQQIDSKNASIRSLRSNMQAEANRGGPGPKTLDWSTDLSKAEGELAELNKQLRGYHTPAELDAQRNQRYDLMGKGAMAGAAASLIPTLLGVATRGRSLSKFARAGEKASEITAATEGKAIAGSKQGDDLMSAVNEGYHEAGVKSPFLRKGEGKYEAATDVADDAFYSAKKDGMPGDAMIPAALAAEGAGSYAYGQFGADTPEDKRFWQDLGAASLAGATGYKLARSGGKALTPKPSIEAKMNINAGRTRMERELTPGTTHQNALDAEGRRLQLASSKADASGAKRLEAENNAAASRAAADAERAKADAAMSAKDRQKAAFAQGAAASAEKRAGRRQTLEAIKADDKHPAHIEITEAAQRYNGQPVNQVRAAREILERHGVPLGKGNGPVRKIVDDLSSFNSPTEKFVRTAIGNLKGRNISTLSQQDAAQLARAIRENAKLQGHEISPARARALVNRAMKGD